MSSDQRAARRSRSGWKVEAAGRARYQGYWYREI